jgi:hypothetical protein
MGAFSFGKFLFICDHRNVGNFYVYVVNNLAIDMQENG